MSTGHGTSTTTSCRSADGALSLPRVAQPYGPCCRGRASGHPRSRPEALVPTQQTASRQCPRLRGVQAEAAVHGTDGRIRTEQHRRGHGSEQPSAPHRAAGERTARELLPLPRPQRPVYRFFVTPSADGPDRTPCNGRGSAEWGSAHSVSSNRSAICSMSGRCSSQVALPMPSTNAAFPRTAKYSRVW